METTIYDNFLLLPLFQGLSKNDFTTIIEKVKLNFLTYQPGEVILHQNDNCQQLVFLLNGEITIQTTEPQNKYTFSEVIEAPYIVELHSLFGMRPYYAATYEAKTVAKLLSIDKESVVNILDKYEVFHLNVLNMLCNQTQIANLKIWKTHSGTLEEKIANFLLLRSQKAVGERTLQITMEVLASLIGETRIRVSNLLNELQEKNLLSLKRKEIYIPSLEKLLAELQQPSEEDQ